jgi:hypothetical protein
MSKTVWRFPLPLADRITIDMEAGAVLLQVGPPRRDAELLDLWALVDPDPAVPLEPRTFLVVGTGHPVPDDSGVYVGTTHSHGGALIWHVFEAGVG